MEIPKQWGFLEKKQKKQNKTKTKQKRTYIEITVEIEQYQNIKLLRIGTFNVNIQGIKEKVKCMNTILEKTVTKPVIL